MPKKIPMRQCVGCREMKPKKELIRVVRSPEGAVSLDFKGKLPGRGAYVCPDPACLARARKSKALERAFSAALAPSDVVEVIMAEEGKACRVIVPDDQLSLAIGKEGQNARLAAKLTGYKIDIKPASAPAEDPAEAEDLFAESAPAEETAERETAKTEA